MWGGDASLSRMYVVHFQSRKKVRSRISIIIRTKTPTTICIHTIISILDTTKDVTGTVEIVVDKAESNWLTLLCKSFLDLTMKITTMKATTNFQVIVRFFL